MLPIVSFDQVVKMINSFLNDKGESNMPFTFEDLKSKFVEFVNATEDRRNQDAVVDEALGGVFEAEQVVAAAQSIYDSEVAERESLSEVEISLEAELQAMFDEYVPGNG